MSDSDIEQACEGMEQRGMGGVMVLNEWMRKKVARAWVDATRCELGSSRSKQVWRVLGMDGWLLCCCYAAAM